MKCKAVAIWIGPRRGAIGDPQERSTPSSKRGNVDKRSSIGEDRAPGRGIADGCVPLDEVVRQGWAGRLKLPIVVTRAK